MNELFFKSFVIPFYRAFLGFFILSILVFGVFMEMKQHLMIAERVLHDSFSFYAILCLFFGFSVAQQRHQLRLLNGKQYRIFHFLGFFSFGQLIRYFLPVWLANHALILSYTVLLSYVAVSLNLVIKLPILWCFLAGIFLVDIIIIYLKLQKPYPDYIRARPRLIKKLNFEYWFLMHLRENRTLLILATKVFSIILLNGFFYAFQSGNYDLRWLEFGLLCTAYAHFPIWLDKNDFEKQQLTYLHNMPVRSRLKMLTHSKTISLILLPELGLLAYNYHSLGNLFSLLYLVLLFIALNLGEYGLIKIRKDYNNSLTSAYLVFFLLFLLIIFGVHPLLLAMICLIPFLISIRSRYSV